MSQTPLPNERQQEELTVIMGEIAEKSQKLVQDFIERQHKSGGAMLAAKPDPLNLNQVERMKTCSHPWLARFPIDQVDPT